MTVAKGHPEDSSFMPERGCVHFSQSGWRLVVKHIHCLWPGYCLAESFSYSTGSQLPYQCRGALSRHLLMFRDFCSCRNLRRVDRVGDVTSI